MLSDAAEPPVTDQLTDPPASQPSDAGHVGHVQDDDSDGDAGTRDTDENVAERLEALLSLVEKKKKMDKKRKAAYMDTLRQRFKQSYDREEDDEDDAPGPAKRSTKV